MQTVDKLNGRQEVRKLLAAVSLLGALVALYCYNPARTAIFPPCPFHYVTGFHCPGCGSLRAIHSLLHGRLGTAMSQNPLMVVSIPVVGIMLFRPGWSIRQWIPWTALAVLLAYGVIRNISVWPLTLLAPH
jgi:hypothetical protein